MRSRGWRLEDGNDSVALRGVASSACCLPAGPRLRSKGLCQGCWGCMAVWLLGQRLQPCRSQPHDLSGWPYSPTRLYGVLSRARDVSACSMHCQASP